MADEGHEVHVYAERWQDEDPRIHLHEVKTLPFPKSLRLLSFAMRASKAIKERKVRYYLRGWKYVRSGCVSTPWGRSLGLVLEEPQGL